MASQKPSGAAALGDSTRYPHSRTARSQAAVELRGLRWREITSGPFSILVKYFSMCA
jgi:hypothetical protein